MRMTKTLVAALAMITFIACSTNPATGRREISLVSPQQEIELGRQAHQQTIQQYGIYDEQPEVNRLVDQVGQRIAAVSDLPELEWTFTVLDSPMLNAMALPGGYVYITRGMLERMNSQDELAGVLGHEIAHVTARHAAQRISQAQLAQLGLVVGAVVAGPEATQAYGDLAQLGASLLFQRYSRQQESQSDLLGTAYTAEAGYNPLGAAEMLRTLDRLRDQSASSIDQYFQSHPDPAKRVNDVMSQIEDIRQVNPQIVSIPMERGPFVRSLEGMITGNSTMNVVVKNDTIHEKRHGIILSYPSSYTAVAGLGGLFQVVPKGNTGGSAVYVEGIPVDRFQTRDFRGALRQHLQQSGLKYVNSYEARSRDGTRFPIDLWSGRTQQGTVAVETAYWLDGNEVVVFTELSPAVQRGQSPLANTFALMEINPARARSAQPPRLKVGQASTRDSWQELARAATGNAGDADELAAINGFDAGAPVPSGLYVKLPQQIISRD